jgi:amino acid transporter
MWVCYLFDATIYPVLCGGYIRHAFKLEEGATAGFALLVIVMITLIKLAGSTFMVRFSTVLAVVSLTPAFLFIAAGLVRGPKTGGWFFADDDCGTDSPALLAFVLWLYSGFLSLGALAGDISNPRRTFSIVIVVLVPFVILINSIPLAVGMSIDPRRCVSLQFEPSDPGSPRSPDDSSLDSTTTCQSNQSCAAEVLWHEGYFSSLAEEVAGHWLRMALTAGAVVCLVGLYNSTIITCETALLFYFQTYFPQYFSKAALARSSPTWKWCFQRTPSGDYGRFYVIFNGVCAASLCWLSYEFLVQFTMLLMSSTAFLFLYAFVWLRHRRAGLKRPFRIPDCMTVPVVASPAIITAVNLVLLLKSSEPMFGIPYFKLVGITIIMASGLIGT